MTIRFDFTLRWSTSGDPRQWLTVGWARFCVNGWTVLGLPLPVLVRYR